VGIGVGVEGRDFVNLFHGYEWRKGVQSKKAVDRKCVTFHDACLPVAPGDVNQGGLQICYSATSVVSYLTHKHTW
jgi:hypothetical protein